MLGFSIDLSQDTSAQNWVLWERHQCTDPEPICSCAAQSIWAAQWVVSSMLDLSTGHPPWELCLCCQTRKRKLKNWDYIILCTTKQNHQVIEVKRLLEYSEEKNLAFSHLSDWKCSLGGTQEKGPLSPEAVTKEKNVEKVVFFQIRIAAGTLMTCVAANIKL